MGTFLRVAAAQFCFTLFLIYLTIHFLSYCGVDMLEAMPRLYLLGLLTPILLIAMLWEPEDPEPQSKRNPFKTYAYIFRYSPRWLKQLSWGVIAYFFVCFFITLLVLLAFAPRTKKLSGDYVRFLETPESYIETYDERARSLPLENTVRFDKVAYARYDSEIDAWILIEKEEYDRLLQPFAPLANRIVSGFYMFVALIATAYFGYTEKQKRRTKAKHSP